MDIINTSSSVNAINVMTSATENATVFSVFNAGNTSVGGTLGVTGNTTRNNTVILMWQTSNNQDLHVIK